MQAAFIAHGACCLAPVRLLWKSQQISASRASIAVSSQRATDISFHRLVRYRRTAKIATPLFGYAGL